MCKDKKIMKSILLFIVLILSLMFFATNVYAYGGTTGEPTVTQTPTINPTGSANTEQEARETWDDALRQELANKGLTEEEIDAACENYYQVLQYEGGTGTISSETELYVDMSTELEVDSITKPTPTTTPPLHEYIFVEVATEAECEERANEEVELEKVQNIIKSILFL